MREEAQRVNHSVQRIPYAAQNTSDISAGLQRNRSQPNHRAHKLGRDL